MTSPLVRRLAGLAPPPVRRAASGAFLDLKSLPARIADPARWAEPWAFVHNVGNGDYRAVGEQMVRTLQAHAGLAASDSVLDIGCGAGRVAAPLTPLLASGGGRYLGFDISRAAVRSCRRRFAGQPHMRFEHLDVWNGDYNASGRVPEVGAVFPLEDGAADLAFALSVFTHMRLAAVRRYLQESARTLRPGGRLAFTAFALLPGRESSPEFGFVPFETASAVVDPRSPERAIAHRREALEAAIADAGLQSETFLRGCWAPPSDYGDGQDFFLVRKP